MTARPDVADMHRNGTLPRDPFAGPDWSDPHYAAPSDYEGEAEAPASATGAARHGLSPTDIVELWRKHGPIERLPSGFETFDRDSRGGFIFGHLTCVLGAPNTKKTGFAACVADYWARLGIAVGAVLVDETPEDFLIRFAVRQGFSLDDCEARDPEMLTAIEAVVADLPIRLYGADWTLEAAAEDFASFVALVPGRRAAFLADTLQTVACNASLTADNPRAIVSANVKAMQSIAVTRRWAVIATGEMNRNAYRSEDAAERSNDMAAGKESGAIEYAAKAQLVFRSVKGSDELVRVTVPKIKRGASDETEFYLRFDRHTHTLSECSAPDRSSDEANQDARDVGKNQRRVKADAKVVADIVLRTPGIGERALRAKLRESGRAWGRERLDAAKVHLGAQLENRGTHARDVRWHLVSAPKEGADREAAE